MNRLEAIVVAGFLGIISPTLIMSIPANAQSCAALPVVDGKGTQVQKSVSPPGTGVTRSNWSTDFVVPSGQSYRRYVARVIPENGGEYTLLMSLKYNNDTSDSVFNRTVQLTERRPYNIQANARSSATPYQVNVEVGGIKAIGNTYTVTAFGCY